eukprot:2538152-Pleurochrysis_carterae.AAC.1
MLALNQRSFLNIDLGEIGFRSCCAVSDLVLRFQILLCGFRSCCVEAQRSRIAVSRTEARKVRGFSTGVEREGCKRGGHGVDDARSKCMEWVPAASSKRRDTSTDSTAESNADASCSV